MSKRVVFKLEIQDDDREKQKAMKAVSSLLGIESLAIDMKEKKLTVIGDVDPVDVATKLRKSWQADILTVGPSKEPEKKQKKKKKKKEHEEKDSKKDGNKKEDHHKKKTKKLENKLSADEQLSMYNPYYNALYYYHVHSAEEDPNWSCVIS